MKTALLAIVFFALGCDRYEGGDTSFSPTSGEFIVDFDNTEVEAVESMFGSGVSDVTLTVDVDAKKVVFFYEVSGETRTETWQYLEPKGE